jgi:hypothetical protein
MCRSRIADTSIDYAFEYLSPDSPLFVCTPVSERVYISFALALRNYTYIALLHAPVALSPHASNSSSATSGRIETCKEMGRALGKPLHTFTCAEYTSVSAITRALLGATQAGSWCILDQHDTLRLDTLAAAASMLRTVAITMRAHRRRAEYGSIQMRVNPTSAVFMAYSPHGNTQHASLAYEQGVRGVGVTSRRSASDRAAVGYNPPNHVYKHSHDLRSICRHVACPLPDMLTVTSLLLLANGFRDHIALGRRLVSLFDLCQSFLSGRSHTVFGLRMMVNIIRRAASNVLIAETDNEGTFSFSPSAAPSPFSAVANNGRRLSAGAPGSLPLPSDATLVRAPSEMSSTASRSSHVQASGVAANPDPQSSDNAQATQASAGDQHSAPAQSASASSGLHAQQPSDSNGMPKTDAPTMIPRSSSTLSMRSELDTSAAQAYRKPNLQPAADGNHEIRSLIGAIKDVISPALNESMRTQILPLVDMCFAVSGHAVHTWVHTDKETDPLWKKHTHAHHTAFKKISIEAGLQVGMSFLDKVSELQRCMEVFDSLFLTGASGAGKSQVRVVCMSAYV